MSPSPHTLILLKEVLENIHFPQRLDTHPWVDSSFVQREMERDPGLASLSPGERLIITLARLFQRLRPATPPRKGKRLDSRWGEFGLLAARYFAPVIFHLPFPSSLRDAWQTIDSALLLFTFGPETERITEAQRQRYRFVSGEPEAAPYSTLSDWQRRGLERLASLIEAEEQAGKALPHANKQQIKQKSHKQMPRAWKHVGMGIGIAIVVILIVVGAWQGWQIYQTAQAIQQDVHALETFAAQALAVEPQNLDVEEVEEAAAHLSTLRASLHLLHRQITPLLSIAPFLKWVPVYGGDLSQAPLLLDYATQVVTAADNMVRAVLPLLEKMTDDSHSPLEALANLQEINSPLLEMQVALTRARLMRNQIEDTRLSEATRLLLERKVDPFLVKMEDLLPSNDLLALVQLVPRLVGAAGNGPQTYLLLIQNEDELRPTGGFLTAVGRLTLTNGKLTQVNFEASYLVDDFTKPYPRPPWQLREYMRSDIFLFRDANWFTDFPTTVQWVKFFYAYSRPFPVAGVLTIDQHALVEILRVVGPVAVPDEEQLITADNVLNYLRSERAVLLKPAAPQRLEDRKRFIARLATPLLEKINSRQGYDLSALVKTILQLLDQKHILLFFEDPEAQALIRQRGWDGDLHPKNGEDFLMAVDANVGFNKTNALVDRSLSYQVDLRIPQSPFSHLRVSYTNKVPVAVECYQLPASVGKGVPQPNEYPMYDCYWVYLRVYMPAGSELLSSTPYPVPAGRTLREEAVPARTDLLGNENIAGVAVFGTLLVIPPGETLATTFDFRLPAIAHQVGENRWQYRLTVQKQPGTRGDSFLLQLLLPENAVIQQSSSPLRVSENHSYSLETSLQEDFSFEVVFELH